MCPYWITVDDQRERCADPSQTLQEVLQQEANQRKSLHIRLASGNDALLPSELQFKAGSNNTRCKTKPLEIYSYQRVVIFV